MSGQRYCKKCCQKKPHEGGVEKEYFVCSRMRAAGEKPRTYFICADCKPDEGKTVDVGAKIHSFDLPFKPVSSKMIPLDPLVIRKCPTPAPYHRFWIYDDATEAYIGDGIEEFGDIGACTPGNMVSVQRPLGSPWRDFIIKRVEPRTEKEPLKLYVTAKRRPRDRKHSQELHLHSTLQVPEHERLPEVLSLREAGLPP